MDIIDLSSVKVKERLYSFNPSGYCGFLLPETVMKKLVKLTEKHEEEVRRVLLDNIDDLHIYDWGLAYPDGVQTIVIFSNDQSFSDKKTIINLFKSDKPKYQPDVYIGNPHSEEGKQILKQLGEIT